MPMPELEGIKGWSRRSRSRLRGTSLRLGLLDRLGLVSQALLVTASSGMFPSWLSTSSLAVTLLLFKGWLIWAAFDHTKPIGITRGSLFTLSLLPDQERSSPDLGEVQSLDLLFLAHDLGDAIHRGRELHHDDHGLEVLGDFKTCSSYMGQMGNCFVDVKGGVLVVRHLGLDCSSELKVGGDDSWFPI